MEIGYALFKKVTAIAKLNVVQSLYNGGDELSQSNGIFSNNTEYVSPMIEIGYAINEKWGVSGAAGFAFSGKNILASPNFSIGIYLRR